MQTVWIVKWTFITVERSPFSKVKRSYHHKGILFQATRIFAITRRRFSQTAETLVGTHPKALLTECGSIGWLSEDNK
ncbi:hypothetical protein AU490_11625 [Lonsdalea populi]|nr:hypothetical protein AU486_13620 [Lonsdalea quercina]RAT27663.1 hypothetical protein AU490_11625 [Lonsdalea populi]RAT38580.1 hypothetical protein AU491_03505 [Lonsdalea populi]RAT44338.1 hypothetical protein AU496_11020 [Lonsdalea populi]RAT50605.1 hypothetical protein AU498_12625 [Lonsdalea populi]